MIGPRHFHFVHVASVDLRCRGIARAARVIAISRPARFVLRLPKSKPHATHANDSSYGYLANACTQNSPGTLCLFHPVLGSCNNVRRPTPAITAITCPLFIRPLAKTLLQKLCPSKQPFFPARNSHGSRSTFAGLSVRASNAKPSKPSVPGAGAHTL